MTPAESLQTYFRESSAGSRIGGAAILHELSVRASACLDGTSEARDAVTFSLSVLFQLHAEDRSERIVTGNDNYRLLSISFDDLTAAIDFLCHGTSSDDAVRIIAALARVTPEKINRS